MNTERAAEVIAEILTKTYGDSKFARDLNRLMVQPILKAYLFSDNPPREILHIIWMNWPGGDTAASCTDRIIEALDSQPKD